MWTPIALMAVVIINLFDSSNASSYCEYLGYRPPEQYLSEDGKEKSISLYWGSDPAHAASALFKVVLHRALGYQNVRLIKGPHSLNELAASVYFDSAGQYEDAILGLSTGWEPTLEPMRELNLAGATSGLGAPRLQDITANMLPARVRLYVHCPSKFKSIKQCEKVILWNFYTDADALKNCGFINDYSASRDHKAVVYIVQDSSNRTTERAKKLEARFNALLQFKELDRKSLFQKLHSANESFLFIDYDMWDHRAVISTVQELPCLSFEGLACVTELDTAIDMRVTDHFLLPEHATQIFQLAHIFHPSHESLIFILEHNANGTDIEEAACEWISNNNDTVYNDWVANYDAHIKHHELAVFYSTSDTNKETFSILLSNLQKEVYRLTGSNLNITLRHYYSLDNFNKSFVKSEIHYYMRHGIRQRLIGAVVGGDDKMTEEATAFDKMGLPVLFYDVTTVDVDSMESVWVTSGRSVHLALAMKHFVRKNNWIRVAVLSDSSDVAKKFLGDLLTCTADLREADKIALHDHTLEQVTPTESKKVLSKLQYENAHIIIVNTQSQDAVTILTTAAELDMNNEKEFIWIVREWVEYDKILNIIFFTISFCCPKKNELGSTGKNLKAEINDLWPRSAVALVDAVLTMAKGFEDVFLKYPQAREDPHSAKSIRQFEQSLIELSPIEGFAQELVFTKHSTEKAVLYLAEWQSGKRNTVSRWHVNAATKKVEFEHDYREPYFKTNPPHDGTSRCLTPTGDLYLPTCNDFYWIIAIIIITVAPLSVVLINRAIHRRLKKMRMNILRDLRAERDHRAAKLSTYLVDRKALKPRRQLGAGRFGCVKLADLLIPGSKTQIVAAKELRDHQNEREILREACILASLKHDNIIRLVGVCIDDGPTLVLMEVAFFGDLLHYLENRRYLAEGNKVTSDSIPELNKDYEEAAHVSAKELTRLAREASSALAYLALQGVIHRDVRASNCLVDAKRSLKLADFGLARETIVTGMDGNGEYACRRRGLFPVLWMAPESLMHGVFSTASDVYSLGVLFYELVTLGARPYGNISPLRVMRFVTSGGKPSMPRDATPQTIALAQLCWQREPDKRPTAARVVAYLAEHPYSLNPALDYEDDDADSGYGESSSTEILLPE
ncbi:unnamed protein product [Arctia plantaginis]|uniref:Protein kinase domain-containing protein n=1 Tax=Arctia plantaginis TaxID=874455 RepID=A0A8S1BLV5_ARCPL|nr:unnamed protein product [Arctia plantaginis]CAB3260570.1 unnamed protein product [Arctia plantaginis]